MITSQIKMKKMNRWELDLLIDTLKQKGLSDDEIREEIEKEIEEYDLRTIRYI